MQGLQLQNDQIALRVSRDGRLDVRSMKNGQSCVALDLQEGSIQATGTAPIEGLLYYAMPSVFESMAVRVEGAPSPLIQRTSGRWPAAIDGDELEFYSLLHLLEERKTGIPWRSERWYTLAGSHLVFESEQYFERACPRQHGKNWERLIVHLQQVVHLLEWCEESDGAAVNLISASRA